MPEEKREGTFVKTLLVCYTTVDAPRVCLAVNGARYWPTPCSAASAPSQLVVLRGVLEPNKVIRSEKRDFSSFLPRNGQVSLCFGFICVCFTSQLVHGHLVQMKYTIMSHTNTL